MGGKCPKCGSEDVEFYSYLGIKTIKCKKCGFDEGYIYEVYPEEKASQKAKGRYTIYKAGGSRRTIKNK